MEDYLAVHNRQSLSDHQRGQMLKAMPGLKERSKTIPQIIDMAEYLFSSRPIVPDAAGARVLASVSRGILERLTSRLQNASWTATDLQAEVREFAAGEGMGLGKIAQPLRVALTGRTISPSVFDMMEILGREESIARIVDSAEAIESAREGAP